MYLTVYTRPDIVYTVSVLSRFLLNPLLQHFKAVDRILQYLKGTKHLRIVYRGANTLNSQLYRYCNIDYVSDKAKHKSVSKNTFFFTSRVILYSLKRQTTVALSTTKAEYYTLAKAVVESLQLQIILSELLYKGPKIKQLRIYSDNQSLLNLAKNLEFY